MTSGRWRAPSRKMPGPRFGTASSAQQTMAWLRNPSGHITLTASSRRLSSGSMKGRYSFEPSAINEWSLMPHQSRPQLRVVSQSSEASTSSNSLLAINALEMAWLQCLELMKLQSVAIAYTFPDMARSAAILQAETVGGLIG